MLSQNSSIGRRLHAARLASGFVAAVSVASRIGKSRTYYGRMENGYVRVPEAILVAAAAAFGVSDDYLGEGSVSSPRERLASRIEQILAEYPSENADDEAVLRLRLIRLELDIKTARATAREVAAKPATYMAHENGSRALPVDRLIGYALALGVRPEFAVLGAGGLKPAKDEVVDFWIQRDEEAVSEPRGLGWPWLSSGPSPARTQLPLVQVKNGEFSLLDGGALSLPKGLISLPPEEQHYGLVVHDHAETTVYVINPRLGDQKLVAASSDGDVTIGSAQEGYSPTDVLAPRRTKDHTELIPLGQLIATISVVA